MLYEGGRILDGAFDAAGLPCVGQQLLVRRYEGSVHGRATTATVSPPFQVQPWRLEVTIEAHPGVHMAIGDLPPVGLPERSTITPW